MSTPRFPLRLAAAAALLCAAGASNANITFISASSAATFSALFNGSTDTFSDLTINSDLQAVVVSRRAGNLRYSLGTTINDGTYSDLFVIPAAGTVGVSTGFYSDSLLFNILSTPVLSFGGNFYASNVLGELAAGGLSITVTDVLGNSRTQVISGNSLTAFSGFTSDVPLRFASVSLTAPNTSLYASVDNVVLAAVPEASPWMMLLAGGAAMLSIGKRRREGR